MKLVSEVFWSGEIPDIPPQYDYQSIVPAPDVAIRYINIRHHSDGGMPDYIGEALADCDVFVPELPGWSPMNVREFNRVARGDYKSLRNVLELSDQTNTGRFDYNNFVVRALYNSGVRVAFVDYQYGTRQFNIIATLFGEISQTKTWEYTKQREQHVLQSLGVALTEARQNLRRPISGPLRVLMTYGVVHMAMPAGLAVASERHGVETEILELFEDSMSLPDSAPDNMSIFKPVIDYQKWLRGEAQSQ